MDLDLKEFAIEEEFRFEIYTFLKDKSFLVILDDVWPGGEHILKKLKFLDDFG